MTPEVFERKLGEAIMLLLSALMAFAGCYYIYCIIEFITQK